MRIVLKTTSSTPEFYGDCDCAVVDVTPTLLDVIRKRVHLAESARRMDESLYEISFWHQWPEFFGESFLDACEAQDPAFPERFCDNGKSPVPSGVRLSDFEPTRTECDQMIVRMSGPTDAGTRTEIAWTVAVKHSDTYITTEPLSFHDLGLLLDHASV